MNYRKMLCLLTLSSSLLVAGGAAASDKDLVKYRQNNMDVLGGHMGSLAAIAKGKVPYGNDLAYHAQGLANAAPKVTAAFKSEAMTSKSGALAKIWQEWSHFEEYAQKLEKASVALVEATKGDNPAAIGAALGDVGKSCKGCHDDFTEEH